jgi:hypothetical protein
MVAGNAMCAHFSITKAERAPAVAKQYKIHLHLNISNLALETHKNCF